MPSQVVVVAVVMTLFFKTDKDVTEFESNLGKLAETDDEILPLNTGITYVCFIAKSKCAGTQYIHNRMCTSQTNKAPVYTYDILGIAPSNFV